MACGSNAGLCQGEIKAREHEGGQGGGRGLAQGGAVVGAQPSDCRTICAARGTVLFLGSVRQRQLLRVRVVPGPWRAFAGGAMAG